MPQFILLNGSDHVATPEEMAAALFPPTLILPVGKSKAVKGPAVAHRLLLDVAGDVVFDLAQSGLDLDKTYVPVVQVIIQIVKLLEDVGVPGVREALGVEGAGAYLDAVPVRLVEKVGG
jgi:hypothetical protein